MSRPAIGRAAIFALALTGGLTVPLAPRREPDPEPPPPPPRRGPPNESVPELAGSPRRRRHDEPVNRSREQARRMRQAERAAAKRGGSR